MIYLLYGNKHFLLKKELEKIICNYSSININRYDLNTDNIDQMIEDCQTNSLFADKKIIISENANMFTGSTSKDSEIIEKYLNNFNPDTILIFIVNNEKIDERKKITKLIKKNGVVLEFNNDLNAYDLVKKGLQDYIINNQAINLLIERVGYNPLILENEIEKIKIYKNNDSNISEDDIRKLTVKTIEVDIFKLIDSIVKNNKGKALEIYYDILKINEEPIKIIVMLANQFRIMFQAKQLLKKGYSEKDIATSLKIHPYRIKLALQNSRNYSSELLLEYLSELFNLDYKIKAGLINKEEALEMFILKK